MKNKAYSKFLTSILIILVIAILSIGGYFGYKQLKSASEQKEASTMLDEFENLFEEEVILTAEEVVEPEVEEQNPENNSGGTSGGSNGSKSYSYKGLNVVGKIKIPKTGIEYAIIGDLSKKAIEVGVAIIYGPGLNQVGNTVIIGHNFKNGTFFSNNKKLAIGDQIYITDATGVTRVYKIYSTFITTPEDADYMVVDTKGKREISLSCCTDDSKSRLIICARET